MGPHFTSNMNSLVYKKIFSECLLFSLRLLGKDSRIFKYFIFYGHPLYLFSYTHVTEILLNPLSPKSDQHVMSPNNINASENRVVMRIEYMIREDESN